MPVKPLWTITEVMKSLQYSRAKMTRLIAAGAFGEILKHPEGRGSAPIRITRSGLKLHLTTSGLSDAGAEQIIGSMENDVS